ncbi:MAG: SDR family NAD(P)-dependent oxidoreductase [Pseudanabaenales cyanobacterium]|nr:SDR family NAD(P)-dependent oxidoreductase [Pseudanabaenales cyanobacterium]
MSKPVCVVVGVEPGNGAAIARQFPATGYCVALLARNQAYLKELEGEVKDSQAYLYDVTAIETSPTVFNQIQADLGAVNILVYNAGSGLFGNLDIRVGCEAVW